MSITSIKQALKYGINELNKTKIYSAHLDAEILLCHILGLTKEKLHMNFQFPISNFQYQKYKKIINKRKKYYPVAYLAGKKEFYGIDFLVNKNVLIPRPETELLIDEILKFCRGTLQRTPTKILEIGTGSGCIALTLAKHLPKYHIIATDISNKALNIAKKNYRKLKQDNKLTRFQVRFKRSDLLSEFKNPKYRKWAKKPDIIVANLPYLTKEELPLAWLGTGKELSIKYEPKSALYGGKGGLEYFEKLFKQIKEKEWESLTLFLEIGETQANKISRLAKKYFKSPKIEIKKDLAKRDRVMIISA